VNGVRELLRSVLGLQRNSDVQVGSLALSPDQNSKTATVDFATPPTCLPRDRDEWSFKIPAIEINAEGDGDDNDEDFIPRALTITIDTHFRGITTLKSFKKSSDHKIEYDYP